MSNYHFYDSTDSSYSSPADTSGTREDDRGSSDPSAAYILVGIESLQALRDQFDYMIGNYSNVDRLVVETHGIAGAIYFGDQQLCISNVGGWFAGRGYESLFNPGARILLNGCNVAEGAVGRQFLRAIGTIFLKMNGGSVAGCTSIGLANPFNGRVYHLWGDIVEIYFTSGGRILQEYAASTW
jgi:hypothetical protein